MQGTLRDSTSPDFVFPETVFVGPRAFCSINVTDKSIVRLFSVLAFGIEWVRWGCFGGALNTIDRYILRIVVAPCCIAWIILVVNSP